jgi:predicted kinase
MSGAPGSGKSTLARLLRPSIGGIIIDHDILRSTLLESSTPDFKKAAKQAYDLQWALARDFIKQGVASIIIDSTCNYPEVLKQGTSLADQYGYSYWYIECSVGDIDLLDHRLRDRESMVSQRSSVDRPPKAAEAMVEYSGEARVSGRALFTSWMKNPCRPDDSSCIITVNSKASPEFLREQILEKLI